MNSSKIPLLNTSKPPETINFFEANKRTILVCLAIVIIAGLAIGLYTYFNNNRKTPVDEYTKTVGKRQEYLNNQYIPQKTRSLKQLLQTVPASQQYLVNFSPLTASLGGYIGPKERGVFDVGFFIDKALRSGIRSFILPISTYKDDNKKGEYYPLSGEPAIVCRNRNDRTKIESYNGTSVGEFCKSLMRGSSVNGVQIDEPFLVYIQEVEGFVPDSAKEEERYVRFMATIAQQIKDTISRNNMVTNLGEYGDATGGKRETELLCNIPIRKFYNKVLIMTDFKTDLQLKSKYNSITPRLHDYVNFIYKDKTNIQGAQDVRQAVKIKLEDVQSNVNWTDQARTKWHITSLDDPTQMMDGGKIEEAFRKGIQAIPIPFFMVEGEEQKVGDKILKRWGGFGWRVKEIDARFTKPSPVKPAKPSERLNARISPNLQPGQVAIL